ncbi:hypothetical protein NX059_002104 [Plenodomus lindquistii]|nr:hypothetical protein NX059_002104 [Plenodomus lindquistii]
MTRTLILFGAGPGIGNHTASAFASAGLTHIILLSRNTSRLHDSDAPFITSSNPTVKVSTLRCDLADLDSLPNVLAQLDKLTQNENIEVIFFNAARIKPTETVLSVDVKEIEEDLRTTILSLYLIAQHYLPVLTKTGSLGGSVKPALLVTNSHLPWDPVPQLLSLSLVKAAQKNMVESFAKGWEGKGVHVGSVFVEGAGEFTVFLLLVS